MRKYGFSRITVANLQILNSRISELVQQSAIDELIKSEEFTGFQTEAEKFNLSVLKREKNDYTKQIVQKDAERDRIYMSIRKTVFAHLDSVIDEMFQAASKSKAILDRYGVGVERLPYGEESTYLLKIMENFKEIEKETDILGLKIPLAALAKTQDEFEKLYALRRDDNAAMSEVKAASEIRKDLEAKLVILSEYIAGSAVSRKTDDWKGVYTKLNESIKDVTELSSKKPNAEDKPEDK